MLHHLGIRNRQSPIANAQTAIRPRDNRQLPIGNWQSLMPVLQSGFLPEFSLIAEVFVRVYQ